MSLLLILGVTAAFLAAIFTAGYEGDYKADK
ncbi:hypothetical protein ABIA69_004661 [Lysinibacillus parviboronicapiens]|uniref:Uncharacterized protein n=1 Tax=Lysinibacillus parviboronicapiens TaxID=436516 RepID=A0ABV2PSF2_9BACI